MKLKIRGGIIYDEVGRIVGTAPDVSPEVERTIECGSEAIAEVENFVAEVNSGKWRPRAAIRKFEQLLEKYAV